ncbi:MAG TPA: hypothetical protein VFB96_15870 [Pirellulaceae bacterium]|nr:hypothetical protein [Pirellulaceae bacterium]
MKTPPEPALQPAPLSELAKGLLSLALILHLICVGTALVSNFRRSSVLEKLVSLYAPYTQLLNLDPDRTPYHLTHGDPLDDDAVLVADLYANSPVAQQQPVKTVTLPDRGSRWLESRRRYLSLARAVQTHAPADRDPDDYETLVITTVARDVGRRLLDEHKARHAVVRCVRRMSQPRLLADLNPGFPASDPRAPAYDVTVLTADVWIDEDGQTQVARRAARSELAPLRPEGAR